jgi:hypothetical protein
MAIVEGYPELNFYANGTNEVQDAKDKEQRSLFALETQLQKTKLCRYHMKGLCKHGSECRFAHGKDELAELPNLQKTRMCPNLLANGHCETPDSCPFAHHENELKKVNICHKTAICTWYLAGKCRNGTECDFAHGEHELKGNAAITKKTLDAKNQMPKQQIPKQMPSVMPDDNGYKQAEPMFVQMSMTATTPMRPPCYPPESSQYPEQYQFQHPVPQWPAMSPPPPGFMPNFMHGMEPCLGAYPPPQLKMPVMPPNYMSMQPLPMMQPYAGVEAVTSLPPGLGVGTVPAPTPTQVVGPDLPGSPSQKSWQLTELAVQFNMLSEEVKRLQEVIPGSMQSTNSGSGSGCSTRSSNGDNRTPRAGAESSNGPVAVDDGRSFEDQVAHLQKELKHVMDEGKRCGKFFQTMDQ